MTISGANAARSAGRALVALVAAACAASPTGPPPSSGTVTAAAQASRIAITNKTDAPVFTFTVGAEVATLINWAPCVDAGQCPPIAPRATAETAYPAAFHGVPERRAIVFWWHAVRGDDGALHPDSVRAIEVGL